jgi:hypothetical protein
LTRELRPALDRLRRGADEERRCFDRSVVGEPPDAVGLDVADLVRNPSRLLLAQRVELTTLDAGEVQDLVLSSRGKRSATISETVSESRPKTTSNNLSAASPAFSSVTRAPIAGPFEPISSGLSTPVSLQSSTSEFGIVGGSRRSSSSTASSRLPGSSFTGG